jgi:hypothetical protein
VARSANGDVAAWATGTASLKATSAPSSYEREQGANAEANSSSVDGAKSTREKRSARS